MEVMLEKKTTLSELAAPFVVFPQVLKNVRVVDKATVNADADVQAAVAEVTAALGSDGRILVRESGTEPVIRVMVEAGDLDTCQKYVDQVVNLIEAKGYIEK